MDRNVAVYIPRARKKLIAFTTGNMGLNGATDTLIDVEATFTAEASSIATHIKRFVHYVINVFMENCIGSSDTQRQRS